MAYQLYIHEESESDTRTSYPVSQFVGTWTSPFCESITIADSDTFGRMLFLDGELQSAQADEHIYHETLVHPAMAASAGALAEPLNVLVVGGGEGATVREVLRWPKVQVTWVDIDNDLVDICRTHLEWAPDVYDSPRVSYHPDDIRAAWKYIGGDFHVIILDLPDPDGEHAYLYGPAFWQDVVAHLAPGGTVVTHCGPVRPFGNIGDGLQRICEATKKANTRLQFTPASLYTMPMPSFQTEWGFLLWTDSCESPQIQEPVPVPQDLQVVDSEQIQRWMNPTYIWKRATGRAWPRPQETAP